MPLLGIKFLAHPASIPVGVAYYILSLLIPVGLSQMLHFGLLNINAFLIQVLGYPSYSLFRAPLEAKSLNDFWGKRWNLPFTEMTSVSVYRPLVKKWGERAAFFFSFVFSGALHEVALSLPVNRGVGLPMLYFLVQMALALAESKLFTKSKPGVVWVLGCLLIPLPILFHEAIMHEVFWEIFV
jgi:Membrane bound O-acyl transferase family